MIFESIDLVALGIVTVSFAVVALVVHLDMRQYRKLLVDIAAALNGRVEKQFVSVVHEGRRFEAHLLRRSNGHQSALRLRMSATIPGDLLIVRNDRMERLSGKAGLVSPVDSGDPGFDGRFATTSAYPGLGVRFLKAGGTRETIVALFGLGIQSILLSGKAQSIMIMWDPAADFFAQPRERLREAAGLLARLAGAVPGMPVEPRYTDDPDTSLAFAALIMVALSMIGLGGLAAMIGDAQYPPLDRGGLFGLAGAFAMPLFFLFLHQARKWLRGHLKANQHFIALAFTSVLAFPVAAYAIAVLANGALDDSPAVSSTYVVLTKHKRPHDGSFDYVLRLADRSRTATLMDLPVRRSTFEEVIPGQSEVTVTDRVGWLRFAWREPGSDVEIR